MIQFEPLMLLGGLFCWDYLKRREFAAEREAWKRERSELLNRIKPETAQPIIGPVPESIPAVGFDNDREWARAKGIEV